MLHPKPWALSTREEHPVIELSDFFALLDAPQSTGPDEQLLLPGDVRVQVTRDGWTALFEGTPPEQVALAEALSMNQQHGSLVPFVSRSGYLGVKWQSLTAMPDTSEAVLALRAVMRQLAGA